LAKAVGAALKKSISTLTSVEICAGIGGLSTGFSYLNPLTKIEMWDLACKVLRHHFPPEVVVEGPVQDFDFSSLKGKVGLLFGGPPCQPWSQAGNRLGAQDPRDVMGITPDIIAACEPDVFLFENVPGLITSKEHEEYRANLFSRLEQPKSGLKYGVDFKILNAADYGVPQLRRRVFIVGIRNKSNVAARKLLADVMASTTHHDPDKPAYKKAPWVTLREALADVPQAEAWRKWNKIASQYEEDIVEANDKPSSATPSNPNIDQTPAQTRIGFWWPKREYNLIFKDEKWTFVPRERKRDVRALTFFDKIPSTETGPTHYAIVGDYAPTIEALAPISKGTIKFSYWDMPRIDKGGDFATETEPGYVRSAWMSLLRDVSSSIHRCLQPEAYFAVQTDEESAHYARIVLDETFGPENHITTFAWEKKYSPQNDRNTPTDSFDYIIVYSNTHRDNISERIGLVVSAKNVLDDGDPRGCYTAGHKGARSGNERSKFKVNMPPYRWELQNSKLPQCQFHWFDPIFVFFFL
jgi:DNA-cytosine methyltransferase